MNTTRNKRLATHPSDPSSRVRNVRVYNGALSDDATATKTMDGVDIGGVE